MFYNSSFQGHFWQVGTEGQFTNKGYKFGRKEWDDNGKGDEEKEKREERDMEGRGWLRHGCWVSTSNVKNLH